MVQLRPLRTQLILSVPETRGPVKTMKSMISVFLKEKILLCTLGVIDERVDSFYHL